MNEQPLLMAVLDGCPPSINDAYRPLTVGTSKKTGRNKNILVKSREAEKWVARAKDQLSKQWLLKAATFPRMVPLELTVVVFLWEERFLNPNGRKHPFKQIDLSNFVKILEDAIAGALGTGSDDRYNLDMHLYKRPVPEEEDEATQIWLRPVLYTQEGTQYSFEAPFIPPENERPLCP